MDNSNKQGGVMETVYKILSIANMMLWFIIGVVILYAIVKVGTTGVQKIIGGAVNGNSNTTTSTSNGGAQPAQSGQLPQPSQQMPGGTAPSGNAPAPGPGTGGQAPPAGRQ